MTSSVRAVMSLILGASLVSATGYHSTFKVNCVALDSVLSAADDCAESTGSDSENGSMYDMFEQLCQGSNCAMEDPTFGKTHCEALQEIHSKSGCVKPESQDVGTQVFFLHIS